MRLKVVKRDGSTVYKCGDKEITHAQYLQLRNVSKFQMMMGGSNEAKGDDANAAAAAAAAPAAANPTFEPPNKIIEDGSRMNLDPTDLLGQIDLEVRPDIIYHITTFQENNCNCNLFAIKDYLVQKADADNKKIIMVQTADSFDSMTDKIGSDETESVKGLIREDNYVYILFSNGKLFRKHQNIEGLIPLAQVGIGSDGVGGGFKFKMVPSDYFHKPNEFIKQNLLTAYYTDGEAATNAIMEEIKTIITDDEAAATRIAHHSEAATATTATATDPAVSGEEAKEDGIQGGIRQPADPDPAPDEADVAADAAGTGGQGATGTAGQGATGT